MRTIPSSHIPMDCSGEKYTGPTRKGVSLPVEQLPELKALLEKA